jgi:hypothetical protein
MDLMYAFLMWSPHGMYSCMPFLEYIPRYLTKLEDRHWRFSVFGKNRSESQKLFKILVLPEYKALPPRNPADRKGSNNKKGKKKKKKTTANANPLPSKTQQRYASRK